MGPRTSSKILRNKLCRSNKKKLTLFYSGWCWGLITNVIMVKAGLGFSVVMVNFSSWTTLHFSGSWWMETFAQCSGSPPSFSCAPELQSGLSVSSCPFSSSHLLFLFLGVCQLGDDGQGAFSVFLPSFIVRQSLCLFLGLRGAASSVNMPLLCVVARLWLVLFILYAKIFLLLSQRSESHNSVAAEFGARSPHRDGGFFL